MTKTQTAEQAADLLVSEGFQRAEVLAAIDSLIDAGLDLVDQPDYEWLLSDIDMSVLRAQLRS